MGNVLTHVTKDEGTNELLTKSPGPFSHVNLFRHAWSEFFIFSVYKTSGYAFFCICFVKSHTDKNKERVVIGGNIFLKTC